MNENEFKNYGNTSSIPVDKIREPLSGYFTADMDMTNRLYESFGVSGDILAGQLVAMDAHTGKVVGVINNIETEESRLSFEF